MSPIEAAILALSFAAATSALAPIVRGLVALPLTWLAARRERLKYVRASVAVLPIDSGSYIPAGASLAVQAHPQMTMTCNRLVIGDAAAIKAIAPDGVLAVPIGTPRAEASPEVSSLSAYSDSRAATRTSDEAWYVSVYAGRDRQTVGGGDLPGSYFAPGAPGKLTGRAIHPGMAVTVTVTNNTPQARRFMGAVLGKMVG